MSEVKMLDVNGFSGKSIRLSDYTHILAYHACRSIDEHCFRDQGLKPYTQEEALKEAVQKLESARVDRRQIESKFYQLWAETYTHSPSRVWLMLSTKEFLSDSSHYLIYGSEFMNALAMRLGCRDELSKIGKPMIIKCAVPILDIAPLWLKDIGKDIVSHNTDCRSIAVNSVAPEHILDILYPTGYVIDPYYQTKFKLG